MGAVPAIEAFPDLFRELFERSPSRRTTGGHHTAALCDGVRLLHDHEEVGRHNAVDKAIGGAILAGDDRTALGLVTTARISAEIAEKAARSRLAWIASRSVPTTMAVEIARAAGLAIIARAAGREAKVFDAGS
jgi:FdhD protein